MSQSHKPASVKTPEFEPMRIHPAITICVQPAAGRHIYYFVIIICINGQG